MVDVSDHGHVPDVLLLVHAFPHLVGCEVNLQNVSHEKILEAGKEGMSGGTGDLCSNVELLSVVAKTEYCFEDSVKKFQMEKRGL